MIGEEGPGGEEKGEGMVRGRGSLEKDGCGRRDEEGEVVPDRDVFESRLI